MGKGRGGRWDCTRNVARGLMLAMGSGSKGGEQDRDTRWQRHIVYTFRGPLLTAHSFDNYCNVYIVIAWFRWQSSA